MGFHEVRFPANLSFGSVGGPERRTEIVTLANGFEERNSPWAHARRRYDAGVSMRSLDDIETLIAFFEARQGQLHGFRWKDWSDYKSCPASREPAFEDQMIGDRRRRHDASFSCARPISRVRKAIPAPMRKTGHGHCAGRGSARSVGRDGALQGRCDDRRDRDFRRSAR